MRYYIAYKFLGSDGEELKEKLNTISSVIEEAGHNPFIFFRDIKKWGAIKMSPDDIINSAFVELKKSDAFFAFVESDEKSEGMLLESGYAKASNKKIILAIKKGINLRFLRSIADTIIEFEDLSDLKEKMKDKLGE
jgi:hypothetical protein